MQIQKRSTMLGAALIIFAVLLACFGQHTVRLGSFATLGVREHYALGQRIVSDAPQAAVQPPHFCQTDLPFARVQYAWDCSYRPELETLLRQALTWDLSGDEPKVLILHTHGSESYTKMPGQDYRETAAYRTLDENYNMVAVGEVLTNMLADAGISVIHDRQIHDYPNYNDAYALARGSIEDILKAHPSICLVLDLHRDAAVNADGSQFRSVVTVEGKEASQIMLVVGTDHSGNYHPNWQENLSLALKLQVLLESAAPGITRPTVLRAQRFNQDLLPGALIVEMGTAGNTQAEAMAAVEVLAQAIVALMYGAQGT